MNNILFTGGGGAGTEIVSKIWREKYRLFFADANVKSISPSVPKEQIISIPMANDSSFLSEMESVCIEKNIQLLVPGVDEELLLISEKKGQEGWPEILAPQYSFIKLMLDKFRCFQELSKNNFVIPKTYLLDGAPKLEFPIIVKPRCGRGSRGVVTLNNLNQVDAYLSLYGGSHEDYIAQELIVGQEYTVFVSADNDGELRAVIPIRVEQKKGVTIMAETDFVPEIEGYIREFQSVFRPKTIYNFQCIFTHDKVVMPFEINPRISTTFCLAISTGFNPIEALNSIGMSNEVFCPKEKLSLQRSWVNTIINKHE